MNKNIKWIVLGIIGLLCFIAFAASIVFFVMKLMKGDAYAMSLSALNGNVEVVEKIGEPIQPSWYVLGNINTNAQGGAAALQYVIEGPLGSGTVYADATKLAGRWQLDRVVLVIDGGDQIIHVVEQTE